MCEFFSFVTKGYGDICYFDWKERKALLKNNPKQYIVDSHASIAAFCGLDEDVCNKYEYNPLTKKLRVDQINARHDDTEDAERTVKVLDFSTVIEPLKIKNIIDPFKLPPIKKASREDIELLEQWAYVRASVRDSVGASVWDSVRASVRDSVGDFVWDSVGDSVGASVWASVRASVRAYVGASVRDSVGASAWDSVRASVWASVRDSAWASVGASVWDSVRASVWDSVRAYVGSFFEIPKWKYIEHERGVYPYRPGVDLWERGIVPSFDGKVWRLHSGKTAKVIWEGKL